MAFFFARGASVLREVFLLKCFYTFSPCIERAKCRPLEAGNRVWKSSSNAFSDIIAIAMNGTEITIVHVRLVSSVRRSQNIFSAKCNGIKMLDDSAHHVRHTGALLQRLYHLRFCQIPQPTTHWRPLLYDSARHCRLAYEHRHSQLCNVRRENN